MDKRGRIVPILIILMLLLSLFGPAVQAAERPILDSHPVVASAIEYSVSELAQGGEPPLGTQVTTGVWVTKTVEAGGVAGLTEAVVEPGEVVTFTVICKKTVPTPQHVSLTDTLPSGLSYVENSLVAHSSWDTSPAPSQVITASGLLPLGFNPRVVQYSATVSDTLPDGAVLVNALQASVGISLPVDVTPVTLFVEHGESLTVTLTPETATVAAGESVTYTLMAEDGYGNTWNATADATYTITAGAGGSWMDNAYTSDNAGEWTVTASYDGLEDTATLTVTHAAATSVGLTPETATVAAGESVTYTLMAEDSYGNAWNATADATYTITAGAGGSWMDNVYTSDNAGEWTVTASYDGLEDTATLTVEVEWMIFLFILKNYSPDS